MGRIVQNGQPISDVYYDEMVRLMDLANLRVRFWVIVGAATVGSLTGCGIALAVCWILLGHPK